jgi:hypothetical protein
LKFNNSICERVRKGKILLYLSTFTKQVVGIVKKRNENL